MVDLEPRLQALFDELNKRTNSIQGLHPSFFDEIVEKYKDIIIDALYNEIYRYGKIHTTDGTLLSVYHHGRGVGYFWEINRSLCENQVK